MTRTSASTPPRRTGEHGFTISELVLVVVVLTGLILIATTSVRGLRRSEDSTNCVSERRQVAVANEWFKGETGAYASSVDQLEKARALKVGIVRHWDVNVNDDGAQVSYRGLGPCV